MFWFKNVQTYIFNNKSSVQVNSNVSEFNSSEKVFVHERKGGNYLCESKSFTPLVIPIVLLALI